MLAQMLQNEFDKENDHYVNICEQKYNGNSKGMQLLIITNTGTSDKVMGWAMIAIFGDCIPRMLSGRLIVHFIWNIYNQHDHCID